jgi:hypothetical protein
MSHPIIYIIGETINGEPIYSSDKTKNNVHRVLRGIWNHRPDHDPPTWKDFFDYMYSHQMFMVGEDESVETIMEQVICLILGKRLCWTSMDEINTMKIEPNMEDIVEEFFHHLEPVTYADQLIDEIESEEEEIEEEEEVTKRKEKVAEVQQILDEIMETKDQKLDQGKYLALCGLLRDVHQG